jgi:hypothetical protein
VLATAIAAKFLRNEGGLESGGGTSLQCRLWGIPASAIRNYFADVPDLSFLKNLENEFVISSRRICRFAGCANLLQRSKAVEPQDGGLKEKQSGNTGFEPTASGSGGRKLPDGWDAGRLGQRSLLTHIANL